MALVVAARTSGSSPATAHCDAGRVRDSAAATVDSDLVVETTADVA